MAGGDRSRPEMIATSVAIDSIGTLIIVGGTAWSVWKFLEAASSDRMIGCALICVGTLGGAAGGARPPVRTRGVPVHPNGDRVAMIFWGVLQTRRPDAVRVSAVEAGLIRWLPVFPCHLGVMRPARLQPAATSALAFVQQLIRGEQARLERVCTEWSVPSDTSPTLSRYDARRAWALRWQAGPGCGGAFDALPVASGGSSRPCITMCWYGKNRGRDDIAELLSPESHAAATGLTD